MKKILIRDYHLDDVEELAKIYYYTIHKVNRKDYTQEQLDVWAPLSSLETEGWSKKFAKTKPIVAVINTHVVGFAEFEPNGHIDCFYCHHEWIRKGVGFALMEEILKRSKAYLIDVIFAEVSITAKPFFERCNFKTIAQQTVVKKGVHFTNYKMERKV